MVLDGHETSMPTALKIAYPGQLDKYNKSGKLLGEHQNEVENDHFNRSMAVIVPHPHRTNEYVTNPHGVLAPVVDNHSDHHWSLHGRVSKIGAGDFRNLTKTDRFPNGISHREFYDAMMLHHHDAHGIGGAPGAYTSEERSREVQNHPFVENVTDAMFHMGMHPGDLNKGNMGVWEHPVTKKKQLVISDYGYSANVDKEYHKARKAHAEAHNWD